MNIKKSKKFHLANINNQRGLSPIVTTLLLVALTIGIIMIIFFWFKGMVLEGILKFGRNIELTCEDIDWEVEYSSSSKILTIVNNGEIPIFAIDIKIEGDGNHKIKRINELNVGDSWPKNGLNGGGTFSGDVDEDIENAEKIIVYPILVGETPSGQQKVHVCEGQYGKEIDV